MAPVNKKRSTAPFPHIPELRTRLEHVRDGGLRACAVTVGEARFLGRLTAKVGDRPKPTNRRGRPRRGLRAKLSAFIARSRDETDKVILLRHDVDLVLAQWR